ncbi:MAG: hypothetical protein U1F27_08215 [Turneriella sp.]
MKATQLLSAEYVEKSAKLSIGEILDFLEEYRLLVPVTVFEEKKQACLSAWQIIPHSQKKP